MVDKHVPSSQSRGDSEETLARKQGSHARHGVPPAPIPPRQHAHGATPTVTQPGSIRRSPETDSALTCEPLLG